MGSPEKNLSKFLAERDPAGPEFWRRIRASRRPADFPENELGLWRDVFVQQQLPWGRFLQSVILHVGALALIWTLSLSWIRQQKILDHPAFDRASLVTYTPEEYLPPLDTGAAEAPKTQKGDPAYAKQPILSVPREADNRSQTIVAPPDLKLDHDVPLPNIVAAGAVVPAVPLDATRAPLSRIVAPDTQVVAPAPDVQFAPDRVVRTALKSDIIAPPPELTNHPTRGLTGPETAIVGPPPELTQATKRVGHINIGPSQVVAPAPQLALSEQHSLAARGRGQLPGGGAQPVGPPPSVSPTGGPSSNGRLVALGIHPVAPTGPVAVPGGNRRGTFSANPQGKPGASGTPDLVGSKSDAKGLGTHGNSGTGQNARNNGSLPAGLHVGAADNASKTGGGDGREVASLSPSESQAGSHSSARAATAVSNDKITDVDRQVFGGKRVYGRTLNMPNLNSATGSWVIKFAELDGGHKDGELLEPIATEKPDPGYPLELMRANVHGVVTLYAVIHSDGKVSDIRVLNSPDDRLDTYAAKALAGWKFLPAERAGKAVALEAVVEIPFRVRRNF
jgi:TonB family protein